MTNQRTLEYYAEPGPLTTAGPGAAALAALPSTVPGLLAAVQGLLVHEAGPAQSATGHLRATHEILNRILAADPKPLVEPRPPALRLAGCCRHFTLLTVAALRAHGIPARARCGFARYFTPGRRGDHWVVEYWNLPRMTTPSENPSGQLLLVAIVEMAPGHTLAGQRYEDTVLELLDRHGGSLERRMRSLDSPTEVHVIRFLSRAGYESFMVDPDRLEYRERIRDAAPTTRVLKVYDM